MQCQTLLNKKSDLSSQANKTKTKKTSHCDLVHKMCDRKLDFGNSYKGICCHQHVLIISIF